MNTDDFDINSRVRVINHATVYGFSVSLRGLTGTVVDRDAYTVSVRMDRIPNELKGTEDGKTGILAFDPAELEQV